MQFVKPTPFQEAIDKLDQKTVIASGLNSEQWATVPNGLRDRAFFSSQIESTRFLQRGRDALADFLHGNRETLENGQTVLKTGSRADFIKQLQDFAQSEGLGPVDPEDSGTLKDISSEKRLGLIFDTQTRSAADFGYWKQGMDPDVLDAFPAQRFIREHPAKKPRDFHVHHENEVQLKTNIGFWIALNRDFGVPWGPWGWGCGHTVEDVDRAEAERLGLIKPEERPQPVEKDFNDRLEASVSNLDPDLQSRLKDAFGDQIEIDGDTARWTGKTPSTKPAPEAEKQEREKPIQPETRKAPVSNALKIQTVNSHEIKHALDVLDQVHDDGVLPTIPVQTARLAKALGEFVHYKDPSIPPRIRLATAPGRSLVFYHELGHFIDQRGLGTGAMRSGPKSFASEVLHPDLKEWHDAVHNSRLVKELQSDLISADGYTAEFVEYLLRKRELWARSYSQWIASRIIKSNFGSAALREELRKQIAKLQTHRHLGQWTDEEFEPISQAIEALFKKKGWLK